MKSIIEKLETWLWSETGSFLLGRRILQFIYRIAVQYQAANFKERAQALTYTTMLSIVPLLAITFSILAGFGVHNELEPLLRSGLEFLGEKNANDFVDVLIGFVENTRGIILGGIGFVVLLYTAINLMTTVESAFNRIWRVERGRPLRERLLSYVIVILIGPIFAFIAFSFLSSSIVIRVSGYVTNPVMNFVLGQAFTIGVVTVVIWLAYLFITYRKVHIIPALIGALFASNTWYLVGKLFTQFVVLSGKQSQIYSGFASVVLFIMWMYLSWLIILVGSQIAYYLQFREKIAHDDDAKDKPSQVEITLCLEAKDLDRQEWFVKQMKGHSIAICDEAVDQTKTADLNIALSNNNQDKEKEIKG
ncbi:MAG TPA: YihY/virulence factor BrkB family protein [Candidatus Ignatzschineria merdigallinarum]|uniref:YihY/virulence factor BrkB family protein n=1 Tax=Candidatus Ignatzschineria merdigallinarum TaxID=2838621 RepID=A0A9D1Q7N5_9GAMM|nr:YihY/virulence factor BrkB family protein [Candidatus Ignatzschineria merdigallinarum]